MATTYTVSGRYTLSLLLRNLFSGDTLGERQASLDLSKIFDSSNVVIGGWFKGTATCAAGDWLLAHATDPLQGMGDAAYSDGFTVAGKKLLGLIIVNLSDTYTITVRRGAANGLAIFDTAGAGETIGPGGHKIFYDPTGAVTGALTSTSNDKLTVSVSGGSPTATVIAIYSAS